VIEVRDESGQLLGRFVKVTRASQFLINDQWPTDDVLSAQTKPATAFTGEEVVEYLRRLGKRPGA
jgi:hypothetical protein